MKDEKVIPQNSENSEIHRLATQLDFFDVGLVHEQNLENFGEKNATDEKRV